MPPTQSTTTFSFLPPETLLAIGILNKFTDAFLFRVHLDALGAALAADSERSRTNKRNHDSDVRSVKHW
jgi:hypothetical protein